MNPSAINWNVGLDIYNTGRLARITDTFNANANHMTDSISYGAGGGGGGRGASKAGGGAGKPGGGFISAGGAEQTWTKVSVGKNMPGDYVTMSPNGEAVMPPEKYAEVFGDLSSSMNQKIEDAILGVKETALDSEKEAMQNSELWGVF